MANSNPLLRPFRGQVSDEECVWEGLINTLVATPAGYTEVRARAALTHDRLVWNPIGHDAVLTMHFEDVVEIAVSDDKRHYHFITQPVDYPQGLLKLNPDGIVELEIDVLDMSMIRWIDDAVSKCLDEVTEDTGGVAVGEAHLHSDNPDQVSQRMASPDSSVPPISPASDVHLSTSTGGDSVPNETHTCDVQGCSAAASSALFYAQNFSGISLPSIAKVCQFHAERAQSLGKWRTFDDGSIKFGGLGPKNSLFKSLGPMDDVDWSAK